MSIVTVVPWGLHPLSKWVVDELKNRAKEYGQNPDLNDAKPYSGPRTAWARVFSNGKSKLPDAEGKDGFVLGGVYGFSDSYGFNSEQKITIGVDANGTPHKIPFDGASGIRGDRRTSQETNKAGFPHRPPPSLDNVTCELNGANSSFPNLCRKITFNWRCFSLAQLNYMIPYFLNPRITCLVEWGWNNYDTTSLVDLRDLDWMNKMFTDPNFILKYIKKSKGNYDAGIGFINDYGFKMNENGSYDCYTTILNANRLIEGEQMSNKTVTKKRGGENVLIKSFYEFASKNLMSIDSPEQAYVELRKKLNLLTIERNAEGEITSTKDNINERVFRITDKPISKNKNGFWLRMDLVQDIINAFFQVQMENPKTAVIKRLNIKDTKMVANPFLKGTGPNGTVLVPNKFAPRFVYESEANAGIKQPTQEGIYDQLFKERIEIIKKEYNFDTSFDDLQSVINKAGESFPVYYNITVKSVNPDQPKDSDSGEVSQVLKSGYWGYLKDLYINAEYLRSTILQQDSVLLCINKLLQGINEALCQICQLKLQPLQYSNSEYSVYDENLPGVSTKKDAIFLPKITLGPVSSAFLKNASFEAKLSSEMMNQLVMQSANPSQDPENSTQTKNTKANPIVSRYSAGDRLYNKGELKTAASSDSSPEEERQERENDLQKKRSSRNENNNTFFIYYQPNPNNPKNLIRYYLYERDKEFLNYILSLPNINSPYLNNAIMPGTTLTLELTGISGIDYLSQFLLDHAPDMYSYENAVWQVSDVKQTVEDKNWTTTIVAQVRPLTIYETPDDTE